MEVLLRDSIPFHDSTCKVKFESLLLTFLATKYKSVLFSVLGNYQRCEIFSRGNYIFSETRSPTTLTSIPCNRRRTTGIRGICCFAKHRWRDNYLCKERINHKRQKKIKKNKKDKRQNIFFLFMKHLIGKFENK